MRSSVANSADVGAPLRGFEHINRYWDRQFHQVAAKIMPGEFYVTNKDEVIVTVLGSCISACVRDQLFGIGGMNHFMLPLQADEDSQQRFGNAERYGNVAMEHLINAVLANGGRRENLEVKLFGGGRILSQMTDVGQRNIEFVHEYLRTEGLRIAAEDLGDIFPRKVYYFPQTGTVKLKKLRSLHDTTIADREHEYLNGIIRKPVAGEVDLF